MINEAGSSSRAILVANAPAIAAEHMRRWAACSRLIIGVDGGASRLLDRGLRPTHIMGDLDSLPEGDRLTIEDAGAAVIPLLDQDYTDLDKAIGYTIHHLGVTEMAIFGATGGRLDHTLTALNTLAKYGQLADIRLIDAEAESLFVNRQRVLAGDDLPGRTLSLMPLGNVEGVWLDGVHWPLSDARLGPHGRDGTSNIITRERVTIRCERGNLLASLHHANTRSAPR